MEIILQFDAVRVSHLTHGRLAWRSLFLICENKSKQEHSEIADLCQGESGPGVRIPNPDTDPDSRLR